MVIVELYNTEGILKGLDDKKVIKEIDFLLSYQIQGFQFMKVNNNWDGRYRLFKKSGKFPIGMFQTVQEVLRNHGVLYEVRDRRANVRGQEIPLREGTYFVPRYYQENATRAAVKASSGIIQAATGAGKTLIISMILAKYNCRTVVYVIGTDLLYQMKKTIEEAFGVECGIVGDGHCDIKQITVATVWSAAAAFNQKVTYSDNDLHVDSARKNKALNKAAVRKMVEDAELFFVDECQYAAANTIQFLHKSSKSAKYRFLLSGTPWRDTGDDILIEAVGGPKFFQISASELIREGYLVPPKIHFVEVPGKRGIGKKYQEIYNNYIVENEVRNQKIVDATKKLVAAGRRVLILIVRKNHGKILQEMLEGDLTVASLDGSNKTEDRKEAVRAMRAGEVDVLIASKIFDQGVDIPELDALVLAGSGKSTGRALQRIGRVIRTGPKNKKDAIVVDFYDNCKYLRDHSKSRYKIYKTEEEFKIKLPKGIRKI